MTYELIAIGKPPAGPPLEKIAVEEHFDALGSGAGRADAENEDLQSLVKAMDYNAGWMTRVNHRVGDFGADWPGGMGARGISVAILSHTVPGVQGIVEPSAATTASREINDRLASEVGKQPTRYAGFASIALQDPKAAPFELERAITRLGLKGAMINGYTNTRDPQRVGYLEDPKFLPFGGGGGCAGRAL